MSAFTVGHFGNTANNAYYNVVLLRNYAGIDSDLPIRMFGLEHAISAPAWEAVDFEVPNAKWVARPTWSDVADAVEVNSAYSDIPRFPPQTSREGENPVAQGPASIVPRLRATFEGLYGKRWAQPLFDLSYRRVLSRRPRLLPSNSRIDVLYGSDSLIRARPVDWSRLVCLEHGTLRWIADGDKSSSLLRRAYREQVSSSAHLWVTNLDPRSLEVAEDVAPGRWSALPHPFVPDPRAPFSCSPEHRGELLRRTRSTSLVLLPASQNWEAGHDKGSMKALTAFVELRRAGVDVGLIAVEWGRQLAESREFLERAGVGAHVTWVPPLARLSLQRMMADADVVWDQFGLDAFGALALHAVEQGTPLVSRGLLEPAERLIGGPVPWIAASSADEIVRETSRVIEDMGRRGRGTVITETAHRYRSWLMQRHSPALTAGLQRDLYASIHGGTFERGTAAPDQWAKRLATAQEENG